MRGITFNNLPPIRPAEPGRMDVVCFIGFAPLAKRPLFSDTLKSWLTERGWQEEQLAQLDTSPELIRNTPVPLESWDAFCSIFAENRLDQAGVLRSRNLQDPVPVSEMDRVLHVIVDRSHLQLTLTPDDQGRLVLATLVRQLNRQLENKGAAASLDRETGRNLIIGRNDTVTAGELTVYANSSLGFPQTVQMDSSALAHYAGGAVKAFFGQGGRKCYFISMGNSLPYHADEQEKNRQLYTLIWGQKRAAAFLGNNGPFTIADFQHIFLPEIPSGAAPVTEWYGLSYLCSLSDVTYVCLPDLVDVLGRVVQEKPAPPTVPDKEVFVVCGEQVRDLSWSFVKRETLPEYTRESFAVWKRVVGHIIDFLSLHARSVQLVAALPLPTKELRRDFDNFVFEEILAESIHNPLISPALQLVFPWLKMESSRTLPLPGALSPPEGILLGILATQSRRIGAFRSVAGSFAENVYDLFPQDIDADNPAKQSGLCFADRICWFDFVPDGVALQSDVTAVRYGNYRYGAVRRIMILIQRAAHRIGLDYVFEPSSERIWRTIKDSLTDLLHHIYLQNGLRGRSAKDAYAVSCGRSTMTQNDIDNGRLIANVSLQPAVSIERIAVDVLMERNGTVVFGNVTE